MEENERENMDNPDKNQENAASSDPEVVSKEETKKLYEDENEKAREKERQDRKEQKQKVDSSIRGEEHLNPKMKWGIGILCCLIALGVFFTAHLLRKRELYWADMNPHAAAYDGYIIWQDAAIRNGQRDWVTLRKWGKAEARLDGVRSKGNWDYTGGSLTLELDGKTYRGFLEEGIMTLMLGPDEHVFLREDMETLELETEPPETEPPETIAPVDLSYPGWDREYYGWWLRKTPGENWHSGKEFAFWDVCATLTPTAGNQAVLELWDSQCAPGDRIAAAEVIFTTGKTEAGKMTLRLGSILGEEMHIWFVEPQDATIPDMMTIKGSTDTFDYLIFLRPWGETWEDVNDYPGRFFNDMMPAHYTDWYLLHREEEMPEYFVGLVFPEIDRG